MPTTYTYWRDLPDTVEGAELEEWCLQVVRQWQENVRGDGYEPAGHVILAVVAPAVPLAVRDPQTDREIRRPQRRLRVEGNVRMVPLASTDGTDAASCGDVG